MKILLKNKYFYCSLSFTVYYCYNKIKLDMFIFGFLFLKGESYAN